MEKPMDMNPSQPLNETDVNLTPKAWKEAFAIWQEQHESRQDLCLRVYLAGKNCAGFEYGVSFDEMREGDVYSCHKCPEEASLQIIIDTPSLPYLQGSLIDWIDDERGCGFLVENPSHKSFRGKFFKRPSWQRQFLGVDSSQPS